MRYVAGPINSISHGIGRFLVNAALITNGGIAKAANYKGAPIHITRTDETPTIFAEHAPS